jgi:RHS repeat-associated protein
MYDTLNRELLPTQGRWLSPDPAGMNAADPSNPQSWNRYAYVLNNPLILIDPSGLQNGVDWDTGCIVTYVTCEDSKQALSAFCGDLLDEPYNDAAPMFLRVTVAANSGQPQRPQQPQAPKPYNPGTFNRPVEDWGKLLGDAAAVSAMLDRLLHHGHVLKCGPRSWRTKLDAPGQ